MTTKKKTFIAGAIFGVLALLCIAADPPTVQWFHQQPLTGTITDGMTFVAENATSNGYRQAKASTVKAYVLTGKAATAGAADTAASAATGSALETAVTYGLKPPFVPAKTYLLFEGDSLTADVNGYAYWLTNVFGWTNFAIVTNAANAGDTVVGLTNEWLTELAPLSPGTGTNAILSVWIGANDHLSADPYLFLYRYSNYLARAVASNMTPVVITVIPRAGYTWGGDSNQARTNRAIINAGIKQWSSWAYIVDAEAEFWNTYDTAISSDKTHLRTNAYYRLAQKWDSVVRSPQHPVSQYANIRSGTNIWFYGPNGEELLGLNHAGFGLDSPRPMRSAAGLTVAASGWLPSSVNSLQSWYLPANYSTNGGTASLTDSAAGFSLTNLTDNAKRPSIIAGGLNGHTTMAHTNGAWLQSSLYSIAAPFEVVRLMKADDLTQQGTVEFSCFGTSLTDYSYFNFQEYNNSFTFGSGPTNMAGGGAVPLGTWIVVNTAVAADGTVSTYTNSVLAASKFGQTTNSPISNFIVGNNPTKTAFTGLTWEWAEMAVFTNVLSGTDRTNAYRYLLSKYALTNATMVLTNGNQFGVDDQGNVQGRTITASLFSGPLDGTVSGLNTSLTNGAGLTIAQEIAAGGSAASATNSTGSTALFGKLGVGTAADANAVKVSGNVAATSFTGDGSGLTALQSGGTGIDVLFAQRATTNALAAATNSLSPVAVTNAIGTAGLNSKALVGQLPALDGSLLTGVQAASTNASAVAASATVNVATNGTTYTPSLADPLNIGNAVITNAYFPVTNTVVATDTNGKAAPASAAQVNAVLGATAVAQATHSTNSDLASLATLAIGATNDPTGTALLTRFGQGTNETTRQVGTTTIYTNSAGSVVFGAVTATSGNRVFAHGSTSTVISNSATLTGEELSSGWLKEWYNGATTFSVEKTNGNVTAAGALIVGAYDMVTNTWTPDAAFPLGGTNLIYTAGASTHGITGIANPSASTERFGDLTIYATGDIVFTNHPNIKCNDMTTSRTITNGNLARIAIELVPGRWTNLVIAQFK